MRGFLACALLGAVLPGLGHATQQCAEWSEGFALRGADGGIAASAIFDDGTGPALYVGGSFTRIGSGLVRGIAKWNGSRWVDVGSPGPLPAPQVLALTVFDDGTGPALYAGGAFATIGGTPANSVAKWDGANWSALSSGVAGGFAWVEALGVHDDGSGPALYAGGRFESAGGVPAANMARWDGSAWSALGSGTSDAVFALASYDSGSGARLYAGGKFLSAGGNPANCIARWYNGSWTGVAGGVLIPPPSGESVRTLLVYDDGSGPALYAAGDFAGMITAQTARDIARWDGSVWTNVGAPVLLAGHINVLTAWMSSAGPRLVAAGDFETHQGGIAEGIATWDGTQWAQLGPGIPVSPHAQVRTLATIPNGTPVPDLFAGGEFGHIAGRWVGRLAVWDESSWSSLSDGETLQGGFPYGFSALEVYDDGSGPALFAGSNDPTYYTGGSGLQKYDGTSWSFLPVSGVYTLLTADVGSGPALYVGGQFSQAGGMPAGSIVELRGTTLSPLGNELGSGRVYDLEVHDSGSGPVLYASGANFPWPYEYYVQRWDGASWHPLSLEFDSGVVALASHDDGSGPALYAGGHFTEIVTLGAGSKHEIVPAARLARWNGQDWTEVGGGLDGPVNALSVHDEGVGLGATLFAGGEFSNAGGVSARSIARWDGATWTPLSIGIVDSEGIASVRVLCTYDDRSGGLPDLYVAGDFDTAGGQAAGRVARWDGVSWSLLGEGLSAITTSPSYPALGEALAVYDDGLPGAPALFVGGSFERADGIPSEGIARWSDPCATCDAKIAPTCTGESNSLGCVSYLTVDGLPSASSSAPFTIHGRDLLPNEATFLLYGFQKANLPFHGGKLCVKTPLRRWLPVKLSKADGAPPCTGRISRNWNALVQSGNDPLLTAGRVVHAQWFQRDPADPAGFGDNLTNGVRFAICP